MSAAMIGLAALGGGIGAALRYAVDVVVGPRWNRRLPLATFLVNVTGSFLLGLLVGAGLGAGAERDAAGGVALALVGTGVLGGYTTFSTAIHQAVSLARTGDRGAGLAYAGGTMLATVAAALVGLVLAGAPA